jgi:hypothetical protein
MIVLSPDALADIERLRTFLDQPIPVRPAAMAAILTALERLQEFPPGISSATRHWLKRVRSSSRASGTAEARI